MSSDIPEIFKALLEQPFSYLEENDKDKLSGDEVDCAGDSGLGPSAALTPAIWQKTIPYDGKTFHLEYMDLEEFLMENGITMSSEEVQQNNPSEESKTLESSISTPKIETSQSPPITPLPTIELEQCEEEIITLSTFESDDNTVNTKSGSGTDDERLTPEPVSPNEIEVEVNFEPDPTDIILSSVPGGELFDPRTHRFTDEELKPQPVIKKAKKTFVPEEQKDDKYWQRRQKNNVAAKRSREARRLKENQITVRAAFLEKENYALRLEVAELRKDLGCCKNVVSRYESKYGQI